MIGREHGMKGSLLSGRSNGDCGKYMKIKIQHVEELSDKSVTSSLFP